MRKRTTITYIRGSEDGREHERTDLDEMRFLEKKRGRIVVKSNNQKGRKVER